MSDHEEINTSSADYQTPVPELDDHRHTITFAEHEQVRRGTIDTLYGSCRRELPPSSEIRVRDFEEAIDDDENEDASPTAPRARRPTVASSRAESPPNSVKAFAEARRRERNQSVSDPRIEKDDGERLQRTFSSNSCRSQRSARSARSTRARTILENDTASIKTAKTAEEDVCFPQELQHRRDMLYIDYDFLENFIDNEAIAQREEKEAENAPRIFHSRQENASLNHVMPMVTSDGDIINSPVVGAGNELKKTETRSDVSDTADEENKSKTDKEPIGDKDKDKDKDEVDPKHRFSFFSSAWPSTIHASYLGDLVMPGETVRNLFTFPADSPDGVWWLNVNNPTSDEVWALCKAFGVHPLTIEDITQKEPREKIELFPSYYFACFRSFRRVVDPGGFDYEPLHVYAIVFREGTLTFSYEPNRHAANVRKRIIMLKDYVSLSSDWICYALIDNIVDSFAPEITNIEHQTEQIEDSVFIARTEDMQAFLQNLGAVRKHTLGLMRLLGGKADVLKGFTKRCNENYQVTPRMDIGMYLGDIQDHVVTMMTNLTHFEKILSRAHGNYLAQLTIDSISQGTKTNNNLAKITLLATVIVPMNVITGLFGMNVHVPWADADNLHAFIGIVVLIIIFCLVALFFARRMKFI